jgi:hypothetical protein
MEAHMRYQWLVASGSMALALGCTTPGSPDAPVGQVETRPELAAGGVVESVTGGGQFVHPDFGTVTLSFHALRHADGRVTGRLQQHQPAFGFTYKGDVTCFAVDPVNHRAWIGGVLTQSNDPDPITEVGDDVWFRVLDTGDNAAEPDRSTFLGFEGGGGIITSEEYCQVKIWPDGNARAWPVEQGNIVIH